MDNDVYKAPKSFEETNEQDQEIKLASRSRRLGASIIDGLLIVVPSFIIMFFLGLFKYFEAGTVPPLWVNLSLFLFGVVIYLIINYKLLKSNGQTIGKRIINIKVVDLEDNKPDMNTLIFKRYGSFIAVGQIPIAGQFISLINVLAIFGNQKRCGHDYLAKTKVINS